jgi:hypothetical protein
VRTGHIDHVIYQGSSAGQFHNSRLKESLTFLQINLSIRRKETDNSYFQFAHQLLRIFAD